jgi:hypothetical protein
MTTDLIPAKTLIRRDPESSVTFTKRQRDAAYHSAVERYVAWARELLDATPSVLDSLESTLWFRPKLTSLGDAGRL